MGKKFLIGLGIFALVVGGLAYYKYHQISVLMANGYTPPPEAITSYKAKKETWNDTLYVTGSFSPVQGAVLSAEEPGKIVGIFFESGKKVIKDQVLAQIDTSVEEANLKSAMAQAELSMANLQRINKLKGSGAVSDRDIDDADYQLKQSSANVDSLVATIQRKTIRAPFEGYVGIRQVNIGQYVSAGDPIVPLQTLSPIFMDFLLPQQDVTKISMGQKIEIRIDAYSEKVFSGVINAINPQIDADSRSVRVQATVENNDNDTLIRPGMYGNVTIVLGTSNEYLTIPLTSINRSPYGNSIYIIEEMHEEKSGKTYLGVKQQFVKLGPTRGDQVAILSGLNDGEEVASSGLFKLRPNAEVLIDTSVEPQNNPAPQPPDS